MLLAIDVGNTNTVFAVYKNDVQKAIWRAQTMPARTADEYAAFLLRVMESEDIRAKDISNIMIGSVVPAADFGLSVLCQKYFGVAAHFASRHTIPIHIDIENPDEAGADRLLNALAFSQAYQAPGIIVDFGTATTFDVVSEGPVYKGGVIAPGVHLSVDALGKAAAKLPRIDIKAPENAIGRTTVEAMKSGVYYGYKGLIEGIIREISTQIKAKPFVVATGGLASLFSESTNMIDRVDQDLTLKGLILTYRHIQGTH